MMSGLLRKLSPENPSWPLLVPTAAKPSDTAYSMSSYCMQPPSPPFPVLRKRPLQVSGSHASIRIEERSEVAIFRPTRQRLTETACEGRVHVGSLSGKSRVVFAGTKSVKETTPPGIFSLLARALHSAEKARALIL